MLFEHSPNIVFVKDLEGRYVHVNVAFEKLVGIPRTKAVGRTDAQLFPAASALQFRRDDLSVIESGEPKGFEERTDFISGLGTSLTHKFPLRDADGAIVAVAGIVLDITERGRIHDKLESYVARQRLMLATMPAILWSTDATLTVTSAEGRGLRSMNLDTASAVGQPISLLLREESPGLAAHHRALAGETVTYEVTYSGREFACTVGPMQDAEGHIRGVAGVALDVSGERRARRALVESQTRYEQLYEACPLPMWAFDALTRRFLTVNRAAIELYGYSRQEFLGMRADDVRDAENVPDLIRFVQAMEPGRVYQVVMQHRTSSGTLLDIHGQYYRTLLEGKPVVVSTLVDVTERNRLQRQRDRYQEQLRQVSRRLVSAQEADRRAIAADLHDRVGQALSALGIQLTVLRSMMQPAAAPAHALLDEADEILKEAGSAVRGVIAELRPEALHEYGLVAGLRNLAEQARRRFGLDLSIAAPEEDLRLPAPIEAALYRISQEALANIAKHAAATRVHVEFRPSARGVALRIKDDGQGFRLAMLQEPEKLSRWGLLMMRERADAIGARVRVSSSSGRGTSICVAWRDRRAHPRAAG